ncbi:MAG: transglycosylase domain-containing protein, partial [Nannocystaceae bacterium]|nr:transglycosylase domain-containing protein [Nannocystaceae bacterium]
NLALHRGATTFAAQEVTVHPTVTGIAVHVRAPELSRDPRRSSKSRTDSSSTRHGPTIPNTFGIPVTVTVSGSLPISAGGVTATVSNPLVELDGRGGATVRAEASLTISGQTLLTTRGPVTARTTEHGWTARAMVSIADGPAVTAVAELGEQMTLSLEDGSGARIVARRDNSAVVATLEQVPLSMAGTLAHRLGDRFGIEPGEIRIDGTLTFDKIGPTIHVAVDPMTISGVQIDDRALAPGLVRFDPVTLSGDATVTRSDTGSDTAASRPNTLPTLAGNIVVSHRGAQVLVAGRLAADAIDLDVTLPAMSCQTLLDAAPVGMATTVRGMQIDGDIEGHFRVAIDRPALLAASKAAEFDRNDPPGALDFEFPFLERCTVDRDPPGVDFEGLSGPYRHRFVSASGASQLRVMAPSAEGFVSLRQGRLTADALVTLEDYRFWDHDGFDREQIRNAFWHNLVVGRVSRGASTVSQQAARNLWLGVDRSMARKIQEALLTARLEARLDKARILELYINVIELGPDVHGVQEAAQFYFGKDATALNPLQAVHIASLAPAPRRFAVDFESGQVPASWKTALREDLRRMRRAHLLTKSELALAMRSELALLDRTARR